MNHLRILKYLNFASVAVLVLAILLTVVSVLGSVWFVAKIDPAATAALAPSLVITGVTTSLLGAMAWFALMAGRGIENGRGRVAQTLVAVASLGSVPLGTAFGVYAIWVCWFNEETKAGFDDSDVRGEVIRTAFGVSMMGVPLVAIGALSVAAILPTNPERLNAEWEPIEDRSQRRDVKGCGLNEVVAGSGCERVVATGVRTEEVQFDTRKTVMGFTGLNGTLYLPEGVSGPRPAAILVHGSGPQSRRETSPGEVVGAYDEPIAIFDALAHALAMQGLVVLTYDKRSCGNCYPDLHTGADYTAFRFSLFMDDALDGIAYLAGRSETNPDAIAVVGHSQGGGFAPHIGAADERVAAVVMLAGFTGTFRDALIDQLERVALIRIAQWDWLGAWNVRFQKQVYRTCLDQMDGEHDPNDDCLGGGTTLVALAEYDELNHRTPETLGALEVPVFAISGTVDRNIPPEEMAAIKSATGGGDAEFHLVAGMGHGLTDLLEPSSPPVLHPELLERLAAFLGTVPAPAVGE